MAKGDPFTVVPDRDRQVLGLLGEASRTDDPVAYFGGEALGLLVEQAGAWPELLSQKAECRAGWRRRSHSQAYLMAGKRGGKIPRPIANDEWTPKFGNNAAGKDWSKMASSKLKGELATNILSGARLEQWQHEISSGGRIWFLIDDKNKIVWVTKVSPGPPSKTD